MAKLMHQSGSYLAYATHDQNLIDQLISWIKANKISKEFIRISSSIWSSNAG